MPATAAALAHDLNDELTLITGYCELVLTHLPAENPGRRLLEEVRRAVTRSGAITGRLLTLGGPEEAR